MNKTFAELIRDRVHGVLDRDKSVRHDLRIYRISMAGTKWGADALARSNYAALVAEYKNEPWCVVDPEDGPLYVPGHLSADGQGYYDNTSPWYDSFDHAALVFYGGEVLVNLDYEFDADADNLRLLAFADTLIGLDGYPIIDEEAFSALEYEEALESLEDTAKYDLPRKIRAQHAYGDEALELDQDFEITVDQIVDACRTLNIYWDNEAQSDGKNYASITDEDMKRIVEYLTPPWFKAACDGLEWADLGYPQPPEVDPFYPQPLEPYAPVLSLPDVTPDKLREYWIGG